MSKKEELWIVVPDILPSSSKGPVACWGARLVGTTSATQSQGDAVEGFRPSPYEKETETEKEMRAGSTVQTADETPDRFVLFRLVVGGLPKGGRSELGGADPAR